jgi:cytochrome c biogenesis protein CcmG/thiol:disulfide interchange protein DsbE
MPLSRFAFPGLLAAALVLPALPTSAWAAGDAADFSLDGRAAPVKLSELRGKFVYLDFWASWCAPCKRSFPWMATLQQRYGAAGLQVVAINVDTKRSDADQFLASTPAAFTVAFDPAGATPKKYAIKGMPSSVLIDPNGKIIATHTGFTADTPAQVERDIELALKGKQ